MDERTRPDEGIGIEPASDDNDHGNLHNALVAPAVPTPEATKASSSPSGSETTAQQVPLRPVSIASGESSARNNFDSAPPREEWEEGPPRRSDPATKAFSEHVAEARRLETDIETIEAEATERCEPLIKEQLLLVLRAWRLVDTGLVPPEVVDNFIVEAGVKRHGNEIIPCSAFMRAIVGEGEAKGTPRLKRKRKRATTYAGAVDCAIRDGMTEEQLRDELSHPPTAGERHGIEYLAERGRKMRREGATAAPINPLPEMPFSIDGDLSDIPIGYCLMLVKNEGDTARAAYLNISERLRDRALAEHNNNTRSTNNQG